MAGFFNVKYTDDAGNEYAMRVSLNRFSWDSLLSPASPFAYEGALSGAPTIDNRELKVRHVRASDEDGKVYVIPCPDATSPAWTTMALLEDIPVGDPAGSDVKDLQIFAHCAERRRYAKVTP